MTQDVDPPGADPAALLQRTGLTLDSGQVVFGLGGNFGDCASYRGRVVAVPETGGPARYFTVDAAPGESQGAVWMGGAAPVIDGSGHVWVSTGNGSVYSYTHAYDDSDSVLELSSSLRLLQFFAPSTWPANNSRDLDMSTAPVLLPDGQVLLAGKSRIVYLLDGAHLGGIGHQQATLGGGPGTITGSACGGDIDGGAAVVGLTVFLPCTSGIVAVRVASSPPALHLLWSSGIAGGPPIVAAGLVWTIGYNGVLYGLDPATGRVRQQAAIGALANHFPTPSVGDGLLLVPGADRVVAFAALAAGARAASTPVTSATRHPSSPPHAAPTTPAHSQAQPRRDRRRRSGDTRGARLVRPLAAGPRQEVAGRPPAGTVPTGSEFIPVGRIRPVGFAVAPGELEELLAERLVVGLPPVAAPLGFLGGQRLRGQPGVVSILRPDLHVHIADHAPVMADGGLRDFQVPVRESYDKHRAITLDAVAPVEVQHDPQRGPRVAAQHVHQGRPLPRGDRGECVREELLAPEATGLAVEVAGDMGLAVLVEQTEFGRVGLPFARRAIEIIECVPDLMAHHVRSRRRLGADDDLAFAVRARAGIPRGLPGREPDPAQRGHLVEFGNSAGPDKDRVEPGGQPFLDPLGQLGQPVHGQHDLGGRRYGRIPLAPEDGLERAAVPAPVCGR